MCTVAWANSARYQLLGDDEWVAAMHCGRAKRSRISDAHRLQSSLQFRYINNQTFYWNREIRDLSPKPGIYPGFRSRWCWLNPGGVTKYLSQPITSRGSGEHCKLYIAWEYRYWYMTWQSKSHTLRVFPDLSGSVHQDGEGYIPLRDYMKHSSNLTSDLQAWLRQPYRSQPAGRKRGYVEPPITEIQALIGGRRSVFGWLVSGWWMGV